MIIKGRPLAPELKPLDIAVYQRFLEQFLTADIINQCQFKAKSIAADWQYFSATQKINCLNAFHDLLFSDFVPKPNCTITFARKRFSASFHYNDWSIRFSENYFQSAFPLIMKTWLHESYHAFLHFLSMRYNAQESQKVIKAPFNIQNIARQYPLPPDQQDAILLAKRNLLGMMDRYMTYAEKDWVELDSYYLNVEIIVEDLTEMTFKILLPAYRYNRSYQTGNDYIQRRLNGIPPALACGFNH